MILKSNKRITKAVCVLCAVAIQFNACAGWWANAKQVAAEKWEKTKQVSAEKWEETKKWTSDHKEEIIAGAAIATTVAIICCGGGSSGSSDIVSPQSGYEYKSSRSAEGAYMPFSPGQKADILKQNRERNGGVLRSDLSGKILEPPKPYTKGYKPSPNEAQIDHIKPRSLGGWNSANNAQVLSREENLRKSNKYEGQEQWLFQVFCGKRGLLMRCSANILSSHRKEES